MIFTNMKLSDLCVEISYGYTASATENNTGCKFLRITDIQGGYVDWDKVPFCEIESKDITKYQLIEGDIVIARTGNSTGENFIFQGKNNAVFASYLIRYRVNKEIANPYYIWLNLRSSNWWGFVSGAKSGSAQAGANAKVLGTFEIPIPDLQTQNKIADFFQHINNKIQLNTQINQTLEQIAQALFKSWFVDFDPVRAKVQALSDGLSLEQAELAAMQAISGKTPEELTALSQAQPDHYAELAETAKAFPCEMVEVDGGEVPKGWEKTTLSEICEMQNGYAFKSSEWTDSGIPVIKIGSIQSKILTVEGNGFVSEDNLSLRSNFVLNGGDIVIGLTGAYVGKVGRMPANKRAMLNQRVAKFLAKKINKSETFYSFIYMNVIQEEFKNFVDFTAQGSAQPNISTKDILKYPLLLANNDVHLAFEKLLKKILDKSIFNSYQNEILSNSRDLLLPRLLDGEI